MKKEQAYFEKISPDCFWSSDNLEVGIPTKSRLVAETFDLFEVLLELNTNRINKVTKQRMILIIQCRIGYHKTSDFFAGWKGPLQPNPLD